MKRSRFWTNLQLTISAAAIGFLASTVLFFGQVDRLAARQQQLEQLVGAVAPLRQMQAMAARFEKAVPHHFDKNIKAATPQSGGWDPVSAAMLVSKIFQRAKELGIDPLLIEAMIIIESACDTNAVSPKGARGLMQLMPSNLMPGEDPFDPIFNVERGTTVFVRYRREGRGLVKTLYRYNGWDPKKAPCQDNINFAADVQAEWARLRAL